MKKSDSLKESSESQISCEPKNRFFQRTPHKKSKQQDVFDFHEHHYNLTGTQSIRKKRDRSYSIQTLTHYQMSPSHLGFLIEQQKNLELSLIFGQEHEILREFYAKFRELFLRLFSITHQLHHQSYESKEQAIEKLEDIELIEIVLEVSQWNNQKWIILKIIAANLMKFQKNKRAFQDKIQFVCRKITLNITMRQKIEKSFMNHDLQLFWQKLTDKIQLNSYRTNHKKQKIIKSCQKVSEKLAFAYFYEFVQEYLSIEQFAEMLKERGVKQKRNQDQKEYIPQFSFQFLLIQILCLNEDFIKTKKHQPERLKMCQLI